MGVEVFTAADAARWIVVPGAQDDKYSRGVAGFVTGSDTYPGAAVLGVEAALHTGVGMVRYLGAQRATALVLQRRPETVSVAGRVQAWVLGSGQDAAEHDERTTEFLDAALAEGLPTVFDGGAIALHPRTTGARLLTPHARELARVRELDVDDILRDPAAAAVESSRVLDSVVLLKGNTTHVAAPDGTLIAVQSNSTWLATAGTGDALAGILGALVATHHRQLADDPGVLLPIAAAGAVIHSLAAERASAGGPFTVLGLCAAVPAVIAELVAHPAG